MKNKLNIYIWCLAIVLLLSMVMTACTPGTQSGGAQQEEKTDATYYTVTFDFNDGSGRVETVKVREGDTIQKYAPSYSDATGEIIGWSGVANGAEYTAKITSDTRVYAQWRKYEKVVYSSNIPESINDRVVEVKLSGSADALYGKVLRIGAGVRSISFVSDGTLYENFAIIIQSRNEDIDIVFDNFSYKSHQSFGLQGADTTSNYSVNLKVTGSSSIDCSAYILSAGNTGACISAPNLNIIGSGTLTLVASKGTNGTDRPVAGNGKDGEHGTNGANGGNGIMSSGKVTVTMTSLVVMAGNGGRGGNGGQGNNGNGLSSAKYKDGGNGGQGGKGGCAIIASTFVADNARLELSGGNGGNGGAGGACGGSSYTFAGHGGHGGKGGNGGNVFMSVKNMEVNGCVENYRVGNGGKGGDPGQSPNDSKDGIAGASGSNGSVQ